MSDTETADLQELREASAEIAAAGRSAWQPACVARAFASPRLDALHLTMQGWIDLEAVRSPLLVGGALGTAEELDAVFAAFALDRAVTSPADAVLIEGAMRAAVAEAFAMALPMHPSEGAAGGPAKDDGFGSWLPLFAALVTQCGLEPRAALAMRVGCAFALLAAHRRNQGWDTGGVPYALREMEGGAEAEGAEGMRGAAARGRTSNVQHPTSNIEESAADGANDSQGASPSRSQSSTGNP